MWETTFCAGVSAVTLGFSHTLCCVQGEEDTKETLGEGIWRWMVGDPLLLVSKQDAERVPLSPGMNFPSKTREAPS